MSKLTDEQLREKIERICQPIHDNGQDDLALCSYQEGRWPKPHSCGLPEAIADIEQLFASQRQAILKEVREGVSRGIYINPSKSSGELVQELRTQILAHLDKMEGKK